MVERRPSFIRSASFSALGVMSAEASLWLLSFAVGPVATPFLLLLHPSLLFLGMDEMVENYGPVVPLVGYLADLSLWWALATALLYAKVQSAHGHAAT